MDFFFISPMEHCSGRGVISREQYKAPVSTLWKQCRLSGIRFTAVMQKRQEESG